MHFENRQDYVAWALVIFLSTSEKSNSNAIGNALAHANACADLMFPVVAQTKTTPRLPMQQPPGIANKPPPVPGEKVTVPGVTQDAPVTT